MKKKFATTASLLIFFGLVAHNFMILIASIPANPLSIRYANEILNYSNHLAPQQWFFFDPVPTHSYFVRMSYKNEDGSWSEYQDPFMDAIKIRQKNPFLSVEKKVYIFAEFAGTMALHVKEANKTKVSDVEGFIDKSPMGPRLKKFLKFFAEDQKEVKWQLVQRQTVAFSKRNESESAKEIILHQSKARLI